jgi:hypothetical protein
LNDFGFPQELKSPAHKTNNDVPAEARTLQIRRIANSIFVQRLSGEVVLAVTTGLKDCGLVLRLP